MPKETDDTTPGPDIGAATPFKYAIPLSILLAALIISGSLFYSNGATPRANSEKNTPGNFRTADATDAIRGDSNAPITIIEYSDFECPYCGKLHPTLKQIVDENSDVKWIFRHLPLTSIHSNATAAAIASECALKLGGSDAFWRFTDDIFSLNLRLQPSLYAELASALKIDGEAFQSCQQESAIKAAVEADSDEATSLGARGTPFTIIVAKDGTMFPFSGALPKDKIEGLLKKARER